MTEEIMAVLNQANEHLKSYSVLAMKAGELICLKLKEKGWDCECRLGWYEEGSDLIAIVVKSGPCCFGGMMDEELRWHEAMDNLNLYMEFKAGSREIMDKICEVHK